MSNDDDQHQTLQQKKKKIQPLESPKKKKWIA